MGLEIRVWRDKAGAQLDHLEHPGVPVHQEILGYQRLLNKQQKPQNQKSTNAHTRMRDTCARKKNSDSNDNTRANSALSP